MKAGTSVRHVLCGSWRRALAFSITPCIGVVIAVLAYVYGRRAEDTVIAREIERTASSHTTLMQGSVGAVLERTCCCLWFCRRHAGAVYTSV